MIPGADVAAQNDGISDLIPEVAPPGTDLAAIFEALSAVMGNSRWRVSMLVYAPAMLTIFPHLEVPGILRDAKASLKSFETAGLSNTQPEELGVMDCLLPVVPETHSKGLAVSAFPPLGTASRDGLASSRPPSTNWISSPLNWDTTRIDTFGSSAEGEVEEPESPLVPWLIYTVASSADMERIMAASVLTSVFKTGFSNRFREACIGQTVISLLLQMLQDAEKASVAPELSFTEAEVVKHWSLVERILAILAKLLTDCEFLQKCAFDSQGVKTISTLLKGSYDPLPTKSSSRLWSPSPHRERIGEREIGLPTSRLGPQGQTPLHAHCIKVREYALKAVSALGAYKDEYRKAFVEQDIVPYIVESLSPTPSKPKQSKDRPKSPKNGKTPEPEPSIGQVNAAYGANPLPVIIAACHALRTLSRSVSILRTTLEDNSVATPVIRLLKHPEIDVQVAAAGIMCNLITELAPMKNVSLRGQCYLSTKYFINSTE